MSNIKLSVIIPVYNTEKYLKECLESVINQTLKETEIICVDDGSSDNSLKILQEYARKDKRIKVISFSENKGISAGRNAALKIAAGEYVQFIDSDDYISLNASELLYDRCKKLDLDMLCMGATNFDNDTRELKESQYYQFKYLPRDFNKEVFCYKDLSSVLHKMAVTAQLTVYRNKFIKENDILFPEGLVYEDNVFFVRALFKAERISVMGNILYFRRIHPSSITQNDNRNFPDFLKIAPLVIKYIKEMKIEREIYMSYVKIYLDRIDYRFLKLSSDDKKRYRRLKSLAIKECLSGVSFFKERLSNGKRNIYFFGRKVFSYKNRKHSKIFSIHKEGYTRILYILGIKITKVDKYKRLMDKLSKNTELINQAVNMIKENKEHINPVIEYDRDFRILNGLSALENKIDAFICAFSEKYDGNIKEKIKKYLKENSNATATPFVSVIVPVYNAEPYLRQCLDSIVNQTLKEIEIICVDDGSTDDSLKILKEYAAKDKRFTVLTQKNAYAGAARNLGMENAKGKYAVFLDADDFFEKEMLETGYAQSERYDADICLWNGNIFKEGTMTFMQVNHYLRKKFVGNSPFNRKKVANIFLVSNPTTWTKMFKMSFIRKNNLKFQNILLTNDMYFVMSAMALADKITAVDKEFVHYRERLNGNLQSQHSRAPLSCLSALSAIKEHLSSAGIFNELQSQFVNFAKSVTVFALSKLSHDRVGGKVFVKELKNRYLREFQITLSESDALAALFNKLKKEDILRQDAIINKKFSDKVFLAAHFPDKRVGLYFFGKKIFSYTKR